MCQPYIESEHSLIPEKTFTSNEKRRGRDG